MPALGPTVARYGLPVGHPRRGSGRLDPVLALQLLEGHLEVDVAETGDYQLVGLFDALHVQSRVFLAESGQTG